MASNIQTIIYPVKDLARAKALYSTFLGVAPFVEGPYYVGFQVGDQQIGLDPNGHRQGLTGPVGYRDVDDIKASVEQLQGAGAEVLQSPRDVGGGMLVATLKDPDGNVLGLRQSPGQ